MLHGQPEPPPPPPPLPPTHLDVVAEILHISQSVPAEYGDSFAVVHCDPTLAKPALKWPNLWITDDILIYMFTPTFLQGLRFPSHFYLFNMS